MPLLPSEHDDRTKEVQQSKDTSKNRRRLLSDRHDDRHRYLKEALAAYNLDLRKLRRLAAEGTRLNEILREEHGEIPPEATALLEALAAILTPVGRERVTSPRDIGELLVVQMRHLAQEELRVVCLNTKNSIQRIHTVYKGSVNSSLIRVGEVFREPLRLNSTSVIIAHNHPSGSVEPSPEDVILTRALVGAGKLLDCEVLDHIIVGERWLSMRERKLGFK